PSTAYERIPPPTSTIVACWSPKAISIWAPEGAIGRLAAARLIRGHGDPSDALVRQPGSGPVDDGLRAVLVGREQREVDGSPGHLRLEPLHRPAAEHLNDRSATTDRGHRALVPIVERLRRLAGQALGDRLTCVVARLECNRPELRQHLA